VFIKGNKFGYYSSHLREYRASRISSMGIFDKIITDFLLSLIQSRSEVPPIFRRERERERERERAALHFARRENFHQHENWVHVDMTDVSCHNSDVSDVLSACHRRREKFFRHYHFCSLVRARRRRSRVNFHDPRD